ncbi:hypothetical protein GGX14DRAFT_582598, partial [Mycena pura]
CLALPRRAVYSPGATDQSIPTQNWKRVADTRHWHLPPLTVPILRVVTDRIMSDLQPKELETLIAHNTASRFTIVSSLCLYVYDYILTFPAEVEYFWGSAWTSVKIIFFFNRYFTFLAAGYLSFSRLDRLPTPSLCFDEEAEIFLSVACIGGAQVIMQLRVHALYGHDRVLKIVLSALFFMSISSELGIAIAKLVQDNGTSIVQPLPFLMDPLSLCVPQIPTYLLMYPVPIMAFDTILFTLVVFKVYLTQRQEMADATCTWVGTSTRLIQIMFRDSVIYFACTVGINLFNLLVWTLGPLDLFTVGTAWAVTVPVMAANRILFNMRKEFNQSTTVTMDDEMLGLSTE